MGAKQVCKNINWTYYNRNGSSKTDASITLQCVDGIFTRTSPQKILTNLVQKKLRFALMRILND